MNRGDIAGGPLSVVQQCLPMCDHTTEERPIRRAAVQRYDGIRDRNNGLRYGSGVVVVRVIRQISAFWCRVNQLIASLE